MSNYDDDYDYDDDNDDDDDGPQSSLAHIPCTASYFTDIYSFLPVICTWKIAKAMHHVTDKLPSLSVQC